MKHSILPWLFICLFTFTACLNNSASKQAEKCLTLLLDGNYKGYKEQVFLPSVDSTSKNNYITYVDREVSALMKYFEQYRQGQTRVISSKVVSEDIFWNGNASVVEIQCVLANHSALYVNMYLCRNGDGEWKLLYPGFGKRDVPAPFKQQLQKALENVAKERAMSKLK